MKQPNIDKDQLEHIALTAQGKLEEDQEKEPYVERPKSQRVLAWVLVLLVILGVILYYFWIFKGGRL